MEITHYSATTERATAWWLISTNYKVHPPAFSTLVRQMNLGVARRTHLVFKAGNNLLPSSLEVVTTKDILYQYYCTTKSRNLTLIHKLSPPENAVTISTNIGQK